jgi:hypothetical protein
LASLSKNAGAVTQNCAATTGLRLGAIWIRAMRQAGQPALRAAKTKSDPRWRFTAARTMREGPAQH